MTTETKLVGRCAIHETKPQVCVDYPKADNYIPPECTYTFPSGDRAGTCSCDVAACCASPREGGEPGGAPMPHISGGEPCRHLVWEEKEVEQGVAKTASSQALPDVLASLVGGSSGS